MKPYGLCDDQRDRIKDELNYDMVAKVFIEFRNQGVSLSAYDLEILGQWEKNALSPNFICQIMQEIFLESQKKSRPFPKSLSSIAKKIDKTLVKMRDV